MNQDLYWAALITRLTLGILAQAQRDRATELVIDPAIGAGRSVRYRIDDTWHEWSGPPSETVPDVVAELGRLAGFAKRPFPKEAPIDVPYSGVRLRWIIRMTSADGECILTPIEQ